MSTPPTRRGDRARRLAWMLVVDVKPLRGNPQFRWLFAGQVGAQLSRQLLIVTVPYQVYVVTRSTLMVGLVGLVQVAPLILCSLIGGTIADAFDRRRILIVVELAMALTSIGFGLNASLGPNTGSIFVLIAVNAGLIGLEGPARNSMIPSLIPGAQLPSALALNQTLNQLAQVLGPALAGLAIVRWGIGATYWLSAGFAMLTVLGLLPLGPQRAVGAAGRITLGATAAAWRYLRSVPLLQQLMLIDLGAMVFGMPRALFPAFGTDVLGGDASTVGLLHAAPGAGALLGALTTGWVGTVRRQGRAIVLSVTVWGLAIATFGVTRHLGLALVLLGVAGAADLVSNVFRNTILQLAVPEGMRGRMTAFKGALTGGGPRLGDAEAGAVAALTSTSISIVAGGLAAVVSTLLIVGRGRAVWRQTTGSADAERPP